MEGTEGGMEMISGPVHVHVLGASNRVGGVLVGETASSRILKVSEACKIMGHERIGL